jgi:hypothetical protein
LAKPSKNNPLDRRSNPPSATYRQLARKSFVAERLVTELIRLIRQRPMGSVGNCKG